MWTCAGVLALAACACAITRDQFYPHGLGLDQKLPRGHEVPSPEVALIVPIVFFGEVYDSVYVNNHGVLSFRADIPQFLNSEFPLPYPSMAAFYTNVDTTDDGAVYYRETNESHIISKAEETVQNNFHEYYDFKPTSVFITTWIEVTYTSRTHDRKNSFQIAVISNGTESFVEMLYPEREIQWIQRDAQVVTMPDAKAQAGFVAEDGRVFTLRGSGSQQIRNIISWSNTHEPGKYVFRVGDIPPDANIAVPDQYDQNEVEVEEESKTCAQSGPSVCNIQARCVDYPAGICCQCNEGFYGNGKSCIKNDVPLRVHGKLNGIINDVNLNDVDIQSYVVVADGRAYTALSLTPPSLGSSLLLLNVLGGVVGWLFAKPTGTAKNGYQLTGSSFNHSADIWFPATGDRVTVNQEFFGHDVFDQITLETDVRGTLPVIIPGTKLDIGDYEEQYTIVEAGVIRSDSSRTFTNKITGEKYEQRVSQTFSFNPCRYAPPSVEDTIPSTLKIAKTYLGYETKENIVRYGTSNKISPLGQEDPCIEGQHTCGPHSTCVVQGDSFSCVCQKGFTNIYVDEADACVDIDECAAGTHNCDNNADCYNHEGSFQCRCRAGYEGNGINCTPISRCINKNCDVNAQCIEKFGEEPICVCNVGYTGDGQRCYQSYEYVCANCSPYAHCPFSEIANKYSCICNSGFSGDGYTCVENILDTTTTATKEAEYNESFVLANCNAYGCDCPSGYSPYRDERNNELCRINNYDFTNHQTPNYDTVNYEVPNYEASIQEVPDHEAPNYEPPNYEAPNNGAPNNATPNYQTSDDDFFVSKIVYVKSSTMSSVEAPNYETPNYEPPNYEPPNYESPNYVSANYGTPNYEPPNYETPNYEAPNYQTPNYEVTTVENNDPSIRCRSDADCPPNAVCSYSPADASSSIDQYGGHCVCPEGYEGDAYECIERAGSSCSCGPNAHCSDTATSELICVCDSGYHGDGYVCRPNFSCINNSDCEFHAECRPDAVSNEYICQCIEGYVKDQNEACIPDGQMCNGALCAEHASCLYDPTIEISYCHCDEGYEGEGISQCVPAGHTCDVANDCSLDAVCTPFENSYQCVCRDGFVGDGYACTPEISCRTNPYLCNSHASCLKRSDGYVCECNNGYSGNGTNCELNPRQVGNFLVTSDGTSIYRVPFQITPRDFATPINSGISQIAVGVDVDCVSGRIYWGDVVSNNIKSAAYDGSDFEQFLSHGITSPEGIAVDWSARNIFWTDSKKLTIEVANLDTKLRKVLFAVDGIFNPRGIAVHPQRGKVFWSDWNRSSPKIEWANMDGSQRGVFLDSSDVKLPNSVAIDWVRERLCYADAGLHSIKCVGIDTLDRETIAENCTYPFGLTISGDTFYWTDWKSLKVEHVDVSTQVKGQLNIPKSTWRIYGVAAAPEQCPTASNVCMHRNGGCDIGQLCLPNGQGGRSCVDGDKSFNEV